MAAMNAPSHVDLTLSDGRMARIPVDTPVVDRREARAAARAAPPRLRRVIYGLMQEGLSVSQAVSVAVVFVQVDHGEPCPEYDGVRADGVIFV